VTQRKISEMTDADLSDAIAWGILKAVVAIGLGLLVLSVVVPGLLLSIFL